MEPPQVPSTLSHVTFVLSLACILLLIGYAVGFSDGRSRPYAPTPVAIASEVEHLCALHTTDLPFVRQHLFESQGDECRDAFTDATKALKP